MNKKVGMKIVSTMLLGTMCLYTSVPVFAGNSKEEVVYSKLKNDGSNYSTIVSEKITNNDNSELINDISDLLNIVNTSGDETYEQDGNKIVWKANGKDIQYQGNIDKDEPITCAVKYELNGEEVEAKDIVGKSGKVKVTLTYTNNDVHTVKVNGKYTKMYTPFIVVAGTIINSNMSNVEVTNGKIIDNGNKKMAIAMCFPGLQESLDISKDKIDIPSTIEFSMDANDFEMNNIISYATPKLVEESDLNMFDDLDEIYSKVNELQDAANQIQDGSSKLNDGAKTLRNGAGTLNDGANELSREINNKLAQYEEIKAEALNKKELENKIAEIVNNEMAEMMPSIKKMAEAEAENAIKNHKEKLENSTVETAMKYTDKAVSDELTKVENGTVLTEEQEKELEEAISKDIAKVLANIDNSKEIKTFETAIEKAIIDEVKKSVGDATKEAVTETLNETKQSLSKNNGLTAEQKKELASVLTTMKSIIQKQVESTVKAGIKAGIKAQAGTTLDDATLNAKTKYEYNKVKEPTTKMSYPEYVEKMTKDQLEILSSNLTTYTGMISDDTINAIAEKSTVISDKAVENTTTKLETMLATDGATEKAVEDFKNAIAVSVATSLNADADTMSIMEKQIKTMIIEDVKTTLKNDETLNAYAKAELDPKIDSIATSTAKDLANEYTEELANEIAKSLIEKQLSGKISDSDIDKELSKYESVLNAKITEVDNGIATLKSALNQLTDGTQALYNGTIQLADGSQELTDGITKFNEEGIKKIADTVNTDVKDVEDRVKALKDLSEEYKSFAGINEDDEGTVSFITTIDSIKKEDFEKENAQATNGNNTNETVANETISNQDSKNETSNN